MKDFGLSYEGNFPVPHSKPILNQDFQTLFQNSQEGLFSPEWMEVYINRNPSFARNYSADIWLLPNKKWLLIDRSNNTLLHNCSLLKLRNHIHNHSLPASTVITVHPEYLIEDAPYS